MKQTWEINLKLPRHNNESGMKHSTSYLWEQPGWCQLAKGGAFR
jgi:hypothetical protein